MLCCALIVLLFSFTRSRMLIFGVIPVFVSCLTGLNLLRKRTFFFFGGGGGGGRGGGGVQV